MDYSDFVTRLLSKIGGGMNTQRQSAVGRGKELIEMEGGAAIDKADSLAILFNNCTAERLHELAQAEERSA